MRDFLLLNQHISSAIESLEEVFPPLIEYSSGDESDSEPSPDSEVSPDMSGFGVALLGETKASMSRGRSHSPPPKSTSSQARTPSPLSRSSTSRARTPSPTPKATAYRGRSRSPLTRKDYKPRSSSSDRNKEKRSWSRGEKSKKTTKRSTSATSSVGNEAEHARGDNRSQSNKKRGCPWSELSFTLQKKIEGKSFLTTVNSRKYFKLLLVVQKKLVF